MTLHPLLERLLRDRGVVDIPNFLNPVYDQLSDPFTMNDMNLAVDRVMRAIDAGERITIYADYDADGIPGSVILSEFFTSVGHSNFDVYLPHRHDEGYGIHMDALDEIARRGTTLLITIDVGCGARAEVVYAESLGMEVIVTDHHEIPEGNGPQCILVHPKVGNYADPMLCGCAVAFQLIRACLVRLRESGSDRVSQLPIGWEKWMLDMVGLSTLADMVPLVNENRILAWYGLRVMQKSRRVGFASLCVASRVDLDAIDERSLTFRVVPRINAASRMAHPEVAYNALSAPDAESAQVIINELTRLNDERRRVVDSHMRSVLDQVAVQSDRQVLWVGDPDWHIGVLSIIAGRIAEEYKKPVFVWAGYGDDLIKGSLRSYDGVNMLDIMMGAPSEYFHRRGGHAFAGGFTMNRANIEDMNAYLDGLSIADYRPDTTVDIQPYDAMITVPDITVQFARQLETLRPWGVANVQPRWMIQNVRIQSRKLFGKTLSHEKIMIVDDWGNTAQILLFGSERAEYTDWPDGQVRSVVGYIELSGAGRWEEVVIRPLGK